MWKMEFKCALVLLPTTRCCLCLLFMFMFISSTRIACIFVCTHYYYYFHFFFLQNSIIFLPFVIVHLCSALHLLFAFSFLFFYICRYTFSLSHMSANDHVFIGAVLLCLCVVATRQLVGASKPNTQPLRMFQRCRFKLLHSEHGAALKRTPPSDT